MECVLIALVYLVLFVGLFICYGVPWLWANIICPILVLLDELLGLCWEGGKKLVERSVTGLAGCCVSAGNGLQALGSRVVWPMLMILAAALKAAWREFCYWSISDGEQD